MDVLQDESILYLPLDKLVNVLSRDTLIVDEILIYSTIKSWMEHNGATKTDCKPLLQCLRLSEIPTKELLDLANDMFTPEEIIAAVRAKAKHIWSQIKPRGKIGNSMVHCYA